MTDPFDLLREFQRRSEGAAEATPGSSAELLLDMMDPDAARLLRLCAIPHYFHAGLMQILAPELGAHRIRQCCAEFSELSFVSGDSTSWTLHDGVRRHLFKRWLSPENAQDFAASSRRLAAFFGHAAQRAQGEAVENARRGAMFHAIGADQEAGFVEFGELLRRARRSSLHSEANLLVRLVHEYDGFLTPEYALWLTYHESKLWADQGQLERAEAAFRSVLDDAEATPELRAMAYVRLGYVHNQYQNWQEAITCYEQGLVLAEAIPEVSHTVPRILHDLGAVLRDKEEFERAEELLTRSARLAEARDNQSGLALAHNGLGTLHLKRGYAQDAIDHFEKSLVALQRADEPFRMSQVYNNLGLAYCSVPDWKRSDDYFRKSLEIKHKAGDILGQASALNNMARAQLGQGDLAAATDSYSRAFELFMELRRQHAAAVVRHNRGKIYRRMKDDARAREDFSYALEKFQELGKTQEAMEVQRDLESLKGPRGLPWWVWLAIALFALAMTVLTVGVVATTFRPP